jgi:hypothetical protein
VEFHITGMLIGMLIGIVGMLSASAYRHHRHVTMAKE